MSGIRKPCLLKIALIFQKTFEHPNFQFFHEKGMVQITFLPLLRMCLDIRKHSPVFQKHMLMATMIIKIYNIMMIMMMVVKNIKITQFLSKYRVWDVYLVRIWAKTLDGSGQFPKKQFLLLCGLS